MELTMTIKWHNLLKNPDDLPVKDKTYFGICVAFLRKDNHIWIEDDIRYYYDEEKRLFYCVDDYGCSDYVNENDICGQIVAWAYWPRYGDMEEALSKEILGKEAAKND